MIQYDILSLMSQGPVAIVAAVSTYTAQNLGAGKIQRIRQGVKASIHIMVIYFLILGSFIVFFGKYFTYLFVSENTEMLIGNVDIFMKIIGITGIFLGILCIFRSCIQGMGHGTVSLTGGIIELAARAVIAAVTIYSGRFAVVCLGYPLAWLFAGIFFIIVYFRVIKTVTSN